MPLCEQCVTEYDRKSKNHRYCTRQCQLDARACRTKESSKRRMETGFSWNPVCQARKVEVKAPKLNRICRSKWRTAAILPDPQIGYRRLHDGTLDPFHDARALDIAMQIVAAERPDVTVWLGDFLDFAPFGRFRQEEGFALTTQPSIEKGHELLALTAELSSEVRLIEGNHDARLGNYVTDNALAAAGLRRAKEAPSSWPVLSVPYLLRMEELGVEYVGGYPSGATYLNNNLACIHGHVVKSSGSTAAEVARQEHVSTIFGHIHRQETHYKTRNSRGRPKFTLAHSPGCLARIDGAVPSVKSAVAQRTGRPVKSWEDWLQGLSIVRYIDEGPDIDQKFVLEPIPIFEGWASHRGQEFTSDKGVSDG